MIDRLVTALQDSALNESIMSSAWLWPSLEIAHFAGLSLLLGSMLVVDLRLAGFLRPLGLSLAHRFLPWAVVGFGINLVSGVLFFVGDPGRYAINIGFRLKMLLILVAGLNALIYVLALRRQLAGLDEHADTPAAVKLVAWLSLASWAGVLLLGRLIPYVGTG